MKEEAPPLELGPLVPLGLGPEASDLWWTSHHALAEAWIREVLQRGEARLELAMHAARLLLFVPTVRFFNERAHYTWAEVDAYEVLFDHAEYLLGSTDAPETWLSLIGAFAAFLGEHGVIPPAEHARLVGEWSLWSDRLLEVWATGCWYERDGTFRARRHAA